MIRCITEGFLKCSIFNEYKIMNVPRARQAHLFVYVFIKDIGCDTYIVKTL